MHLTIIRSLLITSSVICFFFGLLLISAGAVMFQSSLTARNLPTDWNQILATEALLAIKLGSICLLVVTFGFYGTVKRSLQMIFTYRLLLALLIVIQIVVTCLLLVGTRSDFRFQALERLWESFERIIDRSRAFGVVDQRIERLQRSYGCCGIDSYRDWGLVLPGSCYEEGSRNIVVTGCLQVLERYLKGSGKALGWLLMSLTVFEFFTLLFAKCYSNGIQSQLMTFVRS
ncbi:23 kDa integral membrane protein [Culex quinquefasciatus]|uniref:23 kDa integral membrane protein n=1 Tax=Culex quinquefasciatus TaxID=7176 RepID=UPI0018E2EAA4|nr:23 kDa integral membrane protein [Culex quinquefasciatus]